MCKASLKTVVLDPVGVRGAVRNSLWGQVYRVLVAVLFRIEMTAEAWRICDMVW